MSYNKYNNSKCTLDGHKFDSKAELRRYSELKLLEKAKKIKGLVLQPRFLLQDKFKIGKETHRKIEYVADFQYIENNKIIVEDVKGIETDVYKLKKKLFLFRYQDSIDEFIEIKK